jgi:two-component system LytT family response regulator
MLKTILIDDEINSLESLEIELTRFCPEVEVIAAYKTAKAGLEGIRHHDPDLVFLDIEMPGMSGFELLREVTDMRFEVIFVTAYDEYAIKAFKVSAMDYLLKPVDVEELQSAVAKVIEKQDHTDPSKKLDVLLTNIESGQSGFQKIAIPSLKGLDFVDVQDVLYCIGEGNYTSIYTVDGKKFVITRTMKETEELLNNKAFFRTHQSFLVNLNGIKQYIKGSGGQLVMADGTHIQVARARKEELMKMIYKR